MADNQIVIFKTEDEKVSVNARLENDTIWLTQKSMAELFGCSSDNISLHLKNIFNEGELNKDSVTEKISATASDGKNYPTQFYNLDAIISVGYRVNSQRATQFRIWATNILKEYIRKGFALDDERLKDNGSRYFKELIQRVRDIRSSERNLYQQVTDIYATSIDYDSKAEITRQFFATVQNKMHYAAHKHTAAEIIYERVDNEKPYVGMTNFKGNYPTKDDVKVAKNYLSEKELQVLNLLVAQFLDFAELQALEEHPMTMKDWIEELDRQLLGNRRELLTDKGKISHKQAVEKAEKEFEIYRQREMRELESDFDKAIKKITDKNNI
ncbi:TPA: cell filamentation protein Fic [Candidatus Gastranaerophilales bacterium HUM_20]|nr:putative DNA-binding protein [Clostridium sp. CAG:729]DAB21336.1 MAG TPA: cell filamentation protein Fic [Candidatus Gastranaerophilales bacterium HUM_20]